MGGAFAAVADDASAGYYNPAGLAHIAGGTLSGSLTVTAFHSYSVADGYGSLSFGTTDLEYDSSPSLPVFAGIVKKFGSRDEDEIRRFAVALSTFHPYQNSYRYTINFNNDATGISDDLRVSGDETMTWYGPSFAWRITPEVAVGISGFLSTQERIHEEDQTQVTRGVFDGSVFRNATLSVRESLLDLQAEHLVFRVGALWHVDDHWRLGLTLQPPAIELSASARVFERRSFADLLAEPPVLPYATFYRSDQGELTASAPIPWEIRAGAAYVDGNLTVALDASLYGPLGSEDDPVEPYEGLVPDPMSGAVPQPGDFAIQGYYAEMTGNVAIGVDTLIEEVVPIRAGLFTNFSAAPPITGPRNYYALANIHGVGATLAVGVRSGAYDVSVGALASISRGDGLRRNPNAGSPPQPEQYLPTDVEERTLYFFVTGHRAAVSGLARGVYDEYIDP